MANFPPLKNYLIYCIDQIIKRYKLTFPFLDIGCGIGDVSRNLAIKGWSGVAVDLSDIAVAKAKCSLSGFTNIAIEKKSLFEIEGKFKTIFLLEVLEHIENDDLVLKKISSLLSEGDYLIISVPSNPKEWDWDDNFYGHYRRYTAQEIKSKLAAAQLRPVLFWDFTFPAFYFLRKIYTRLKVMPGASTENKSSRSLRSALVNAWHMPPFVSFLMQKLIFWDIIYKIQFRYFRHRIEKGHEMLILAKKEA